MTSLSKTSITKLVLASLMLSSATPIVFADTTSLIKDFDKREETKDTVIITGVTEEVRGHRPGLETFASVLVNSELHGTNPGEINNCDAIKINYRLLDKDGDIEDIFTTRKKIEWFLEVRPKGTEPGQGKQFEFAFPNAKTGENEDPLASYRDRRSDIKAQDKLLTLQLYNEIRVREKNDKTNVYALPDLKQFLLSQNAQGNTIHIGYRIQPYTSVGFPNTSLTQLIVNRFDKLTRLDPQLDIDVEAQSTSLIDDDIKNLLNELIFNRTIDPVFAKYEYIESNEIKVLKDLPCPLPPEIEDESYMIAYYLPDGTRVDFLSTDTQFDVKFFYDANGNKAIDNPSELITQALLADGAKDINSKPFVNGLRLLVGLDEAELDLNIDDGDNDPLNDSVFSEAAKICSTGDTDNSTCVVSKGIALDEMRNKPKETFFWVDTSTQERKLFFRTVEGYPIPEDLTDINISPKVLPYFDNDKNNAITLQRFRLNVTSEYPSDEIKNPTIPSTPTSRSEVIDE